MIHRFLFVVVAVVGVVSAFAGSSAWAQGEKPFHAVVTVAPLQGIVEPMLPPGSTMTVLMQPGRSEHGYEFSPGDLAKLANADLVVYVGLNLEPKVAEWLRDHPNSKRRVVEFASAVGIGAEGVAADPHSSHEDGDGHKHEEAHEHVHDATCEHNHLGPDQHLWLDPVLVKQLVPEIRAAIQHGLSDRNAADEIRNGVNERMDALLAKVEATDAAWKDAFATRQGAAIVTHHNAFGRPATRYGFVVADAIRTSEGAEPTPADIARVVAAIKEKKVQAIFVEPQFNPKVANRIAKVAKVKVAKIDPIGNGDWFGLMESNLKSIIENIGPGGGAAPTAADGYPAKQP